MKKHNVISTLIAILITVFAFLAGMLVQQEREEAKRSSVIKVADNGAGTEARMENSVRLLPGTTVEMLTPDFWKTEDGEELLFTAEEIEDYQKNNPLSVQYYDELEGRKLRLFPYDMPMELRGGIVTELIDLSYLEDSMAGTIKPYVNGELPEKGYWSDLKENCALDAIPNQVTPRYYVCVKRDMAQAYPSEDFVSSDSEEIYCSDFVVAEVMPFTGVVALHESRDKKWCFVINGSYCGWVKKESLALCKDREEWLDALSPEDFLMVTGCEITLDETAIPTVTEGLVLPMGTKIKLFRDFDGKVCGREPYNCYVVMIPYGNENGELEWETTLIPTSKDVTIGYLPMTSNVVIEQAFKFLGKIYGWGGSFSSNDCSGLVRQVYACFGFELPRNSAAIGEIFDLGERAYSASIASKKLEIMEKIPTGSLLIMEGHMMIYLGMVGKEPYVISSCATFISPEDGSGGLVEPYGIFVSNLELLRKDGKTWLESIKYFQWREY